MNGRQLEAGYHPKRLRGRFGSCIGGQWNLHPIRWKEKDIQSGFREKYRNWGASFL
jgi:hypothetical protein